MIKVIKSNKIFSLCLIVTILVFVLGIFFNSFIDTEIKKDVFNNIDIIIENFKNYKFSFNVLFSNIFNNSLFILIIWFLGISVIGSVLLLILYLIKVFVLGFELISLLSYLGIKNILFIGLYLCTDILYLIILFVVVYYGISFSIILFRVLFLNKNINLSNIMIKYIKVLLFCLLGSLIVNLLDVFIVSNIIKLLI